MSAKNQCLVIFHPIFSLISRLVVPLALLIAIATLLLPLSDTYLLASFNAPAAQAGVVIDSFTTPNPYLLPNATNGNGAQVEITSSDAIPGDNGEWRYTGVDTDRTDYSLDVSNGAFSLSVPANGSKLDPALTWAGGPSGDGTPLSFSPYVDLTAGGADSFRLVVTTPAGQDDIVAAIVVSSPDTINGYIFPGDLSQALFTIPAGLSAAEIRIPFSSLLPIEGYFPGSFTPADLTEVSGLWIDFGQLGHRLTATSLSIDIIDTASSHVGPPRNKEQCRNGGWMNFDLPRRFKNQGNCIQFVNTGK
ncbi:hypothetical protein EPO44_14360 [bacterium]|nr:MAG: hypothetical protein EPO44_14360 [bacterium]